MYFHFTKVISYKAISKTEAWRGMEWKKDITFINQVRALTIFGFLILFSFIVRFPQFSDGAILTVRLINLAVVVQ